jgi:ABC-type antimicrobial peptide transport system permease subunit
MTLGTLIRRSLRFHARTHFGVVLGAIIGSAALTGALIVGDSVKQSLSERALDRLQSVYYTLATGDRFFIADLAQRLFQGAPASRRHDAAPRTAELAGGTPALPGQAATAMLLLGTAARQDSSARANRIQVLGVGTATWPAFARWRTTLSADVLNRWQTGSSVLLNETLAQQLDVKPGDEIVLRIRKPTALAQDAVITPRNDTSLALRLQVGSILPAALLGDFDLSANQTPMPNAFLPFDFLAQKLDLTGRANLLVSGRPPAGAEASWLQTQETRLKDAWSLEDAQLSVRAIESPFNSTSSNSLAPTIEITTSRVFLDGPVVAAAGVSRANQSAQGAPVAIGVLTYLANLLQSGERAAPYSMVTAVGPPFTPADMRDDEILVNEWLAEDLQIKAGDKVALSYFVIDSGSHLVERTNSFRVRATVPMRGIYADRTLMPDFPGVAKAESTHDWDTGFPLVHKIRDKDEAYWKAYRGTPKAFITLAAGQAMWANRFGSLTAIRSVVAPGSSAKECRDSIYQNLRARLEPAQLGFHFEPVRDRALRAVEQSQPFGELFIGFSFFLIVAALLLMALLFQFSLEQRAAEVGTLLAVGFTPRRVRLLLLSEGAALGLVGAVVGVAGGLGYSKGVLRGLATIWQNAIGGSPLKFHATLQTLLIGLLSSTLIAVLTIWLTLRKQAKRPAYELLSGADATSNKRDRNWMRWIALVCGVAAIVTVMWALLTDQANNPEVFFSAGSLLLIAGLAAASTWFRNLGRLARPDTFNRTSLAVRGCGRRRKRSVATIALLASGCFVIVSIGVFRLDANVDAWRRSSGTGGFALIGESALPIVQDFNTQSGREFFGLSAQDTEGVRSVAFRVHDGDEASCLNLNRAQKPRLLGVDPESLVGRFTFAGAATDHKAAEEWGLLRNGSWNRGWKVEDRGLAGTPSSIRDSPSSFPGVSGSQEPVPAIGDANSIEWALGKKLGDTLDYTDEHGRTFKLQLVGSVANSVLQGSLIIDEAEFVRRFPSESGYRFFLIDAPSNAVAEVSATFSRALQDVGLELTPAAKRLNAFNAVQNTYLGTFQVLGGLGLLLGSAGLGVVVLRNVLERRGELALLLAVGFRRRTLQWLVLAEHGALLGLGLALGLGAAFFAVLPSLLSPGGRLPYTSLTFTLVAVLLNGVIWTWLATRFALRGNLLEALRNE